MAQPNFSHDDLLDVGEQILALAKRYGAQKADTVASYGTDFEVKVADGSISNLTQATAKGLGLRVLVDGKLGFCTTSDFRTETLETLVQQAVGMAREVEVDPFQDIAEAPVGRIDAGDELELYDPAIANIPTEEKIRWAHQLEEAARDADPRVTKFRDSGVSSGESWSVLVTSTGVVRTIRGTGIALWCNPIAEEDGQLQTEVWYDSKCHLEDLESVEAIGRQAGQRAARMLGAKPISTQRVPVIFEPQMTIGFFGGLLGAIDGDTVHKKASFLGDSLGETIAAPSISLVDDPLLKRGSGSAPFDGEGIPTYAKRLIDHGKLTTFLYDSYTARKTGHTSTASARRGASSLPSAGVFNLLVEAGSDKLASMLSSVPQALVITRGLGRGINVITGEYSRGANGLWVEGGEIVHPVQEITIAGDVREMLQRIDAVGDDLTMRGSSGAPSIRIQDMTVSGA